MNATERIQRRDADRERSRGWHHARRARGICGNAPCTNRPELNPRTGHIHALALSPDGRDFITTSARCYPQFTNTARQSKRFE